MITKTVLNNAKLLQWHIYKNMILPFFGQFCGPSNISHFLFTFYFTTLKLLRTLNVGYEIFLDVLPEINKYVEYKHYLYALIAVDHVAYLIIHPGRNACNFHTS